MALKQRGVSAEYLGSAQLDQQEVAHAVQKGEVSVVYLTPEKACSLPPRYTTATATGGRTSCFGGGPFLAVLRGSLSCVLCAPL